MLINWHQVFNIDVDLECNIGANYKTSTYCLLENYKQFNTKQTYVRQVQRHTKRAQPGHVVVYLQIDSVLFQNPWIQRTRIQSRCWGCQGRSSCSQRQQTDLCGEKM